MTRTTGVGRCGSARRLAADRYNGRAPIKRATSLTQSRKSSPPSVSDVEYRAQPQRARLLREITRGDLRTRSRTGLPSRAVVDLAAIRHNLGVLRRRPDAKSSSSRPSRPTPTVTAWFPIALAALEGGADWLGCAAGWPRAKGRAGTRRRPSPSRGFHLRFCCGIRSGQRLRGLDVGACRHLRHRPAGGRPSRVRQGVGMSRAGSTLADLPACNLGLRGGDRDSSLSWARWSLCRADSPTEAGNVLDANHVRIFEGAGNPGRQVSRRASVTWPPPPESYGTRDALRHGPRGHRPVWSSPDPAVASSELGWFPP